MKTPDGARTTYVGLEHVEAIQQWIADPSIASTTRVPNPYPADGARDFVTRCMAERIEGKTHVLAILVGSEFVGLCGLHDATGAQGAEIGYWIGKPFRQRGLATFGVRMALELGFKNLRLERVHADALETNLPSRRVLEANGFRLRGHRNHTEPHWDRTARLAEYELTAGAWLEHMRKPILDRLHPALRGILEVELAAGNRIREVTTGNPDPDSVTVRLEEPFHHRKTMLPDGVRYTEVNDPHWWVGEFATANPRHLLIH